MKLTVFEDTHVGGFEVWAGLEGSDPRADSFGFCVGSGNTREEAVEDAKRIIASAVGEMVQLESIRRG